MKKSWSNVAWARWGWLAITLVASASLVVASWANYRSARGATAPLDLSQGRLLEGAVRALVVRNEGNVTRADLETLISERERDGLRFVALVDEEGRLVASAGSPAAPPLVDPRADGATGPGVARVGTRIRMFFSRPPSAPASPALAGPPSAPAPPALPGPAGEPWRRYRPILEFEPVVASQLVGRATRTLWLSGAGAAVMLLAAAIFWRLSQRYEQSQRSLERERRLGLIGEMSAVLAHEIRNPLASLKGHAQLLAERLPADTAERRNADRVVLEAVRLEGLTADLLDFSGPGALDVKSVDPARLVRGAAEEVDSDGFDLDLDGAPERWPLDARRFGQAITNLLRNARQFSPPAHRPRVSLSSANGVMMVAIRDHGPGLPPGQEERIFDPFFTTRTTGTGLGLSVARRNIALHGGRLTAENHPKGGAVFRIVVPR